MIEHVIAAAVNHAGFDDRVIKTGVAHDLFRSPFRLVIRGTTVRPRAEKTCEHDLFDSRTPRRLDYVSRAVDVNARVGLFASFSIDARAMRDCLTSSKGVS